jgi:hypothetical protein
MRELSVLSRSGFECGQLHLDHPHHGLHRFRVTNQLTDIAWHDLPAKTETVCKPAAGHGLAALDQLAPVAVNLLLGVAADKEREGGVELMSGTAVEKDHLLTFELDRDRGDLTHGPWTDTLRTQLVDPARVRKDAEIEFGGFFGIVIEPEEGRKFVHGWHGSSQNPPIGNPDFSLGTLGVRSPRFIRRLSRNPASMALSTI